MSQVAKYSDKRAIVPKSYPPGGCVVHLDRKKCGETKGLDIILDFQKLYQDKMSEIDVSAGGDSLQEKVNLQQEWINDLTEQNKMLAKVIEELEIEAISRVKHLEDKLQNAAKSFGEVANLADLEDRERKIEELKERLKNCEIEKQKIDAEKSQSWEMVEPPPSDAKGPIKAGEGTEKTGAPEKASATSGNIPAATADDKKSQSWEMVEPVPTSEGEEKKGGVPHKASEASGNVPAATADDKKSQSWEIIEPETSDAKGSMKIGEETAKTGEHPEKPSAASEKPSSASEKLRPEIQKSEHHNNALEVIEKLKKENEQLREGEEIQRLTKEVDDKMRKISELQEENRDLNDVINYMKNNQALISKYADEIEDLKKTLKWTKKEKEEYECLKEKVKSLEQGKGDTEGVTVNLQTAVNLYANTVEILEQSEQKLKFEVDQYKMINEATQEALASLAYESQEIKGKFQRDMEEQLWLNFLLNIDNIDIQHTNNIYKQQLDKQQNLYLQLMELNYNLEVEHVNTLQDLSMLETQFYKYQHFLKSQEDDNVVMKSQMKKLSKKNKCYEEVVKFFKQEMSVMSDELLTLQEVLNITNVSSLEENNKLINAILQLRRINDGLVSHLCAIEKQVVLENQINQINEARINELQHIIGEKNNDLSEHDGIIHDMRKKLTNANKQNSDLKKTIKNLTDTVVEIQDGIKSVENEYKKNLGEVSAVESKICLVNGNLEEIKVCMGQKNEKITMLENRVKDQEVSLILAHKELQMLKEKKLENKNLINSLKEQIMIAEDKNSKIIEDYHVVVKQLQDHNSLNHMKNFELHHYKSLVEEMKMSLMQLNEGLEKCEATNIHFLEDSRKFDPLHSFNTSKKSSLSIALGELKKSMSDIRKKLTEADIKGGLIEEEIVKVRESHMSLIQEDSSEVSKELEVKIFSSVKEQTKLILQINEQKEEIERLKQELMQREKEREVCSFKRSVSELKNEKMVSNAQMEISQLKSDLNKSFERQRMMNEENDNLHTQMINLTKKLTMMEHAYEVLKEENEECKIELRKALREKEYSAYKSQEMAKNLTQLKNSHDNLEKQCRYNNDCIRNLELELSEARSEKDCLSNEAENLIGVVKRWLEEQNVVNGKIRGQFQNQQNTINSMKQLLLKRTSEHPSWENVIPSASCSPKRHATAPEPHRHSSPKRTRRSQRKSPERRHRHSSPWPRNDEFEEYFPTIDLYEQKLRKTSYDSYSSPFSSRSPSPRSNSEMVDGDNEEVNLDDWFSPHYKETDTDLDDGDEDSFINKLELMTVQVQEANKKWQRKMNRDRGSRGRVMK